MKFEELQRHTLELPERDRAFWAAELLSSLPAVLIDEGDVVSDLRRRAKELDEDPSAGCS